MMRLLSRAHRFGGIIGSQIHSGQPGRPAHARLAEWHAGDAESAEVMAAGCAADRLYVSLVGGLDNLGELIDELAKRDHRLTGKTDGEVIAHAYEQWGEACVERFRGAFAVAVWDERAQTLLLARDRGGARSLYYQPGEKAFAYASDLATLRALTDVPGEVEPQAIDAFLTFRAVPAPLSIFPSVRKLPAAHVLRLANGIPTVKPYWSLDFGQKEPARAVGVEERLAELLRQVMREMTEGRSWGLMFSGGLDASILLEALSGVARDHPVPAFTFAFPEKPEEAESARRIASRFATEHHVFDVEPRIAEAVSKVVARFDQPYANDAALPMSYMTSLLFGKTEMALTGEGADDVFCGRERHLACMTMARLEHIPGLALGAAACAPLTAGRVRLLLDGMRLPMIDRLLRWVGAFHPDEKTRLYTPEFAARIDPDYPGALLRGLIPAGAHPLDQMLAADLGIWVAEVLRAKLDPAEGADGVVMRTPFLDYRVVEFSARLQPNVKVGWVTTKAVLRRLARRRGISVRTPLMRGVKTKISLAKILRGELRPLLEESLFSPRAEARGYFCPAAVRRLADEHLTGRADHSRQLWALLMLELWHRRHLDR
jgi:asparagine synthase (glutamine-hydrolysing)